MGEVNKLSRDSPLGSMHRLHRVDAIQQSHSAYQRRGLRWLQEKALRDGYMMSFEVIRAVEYNTLFKQKQIPNGDIHAINSVILGNEVYYIEPQTREIVFVAYLD